MNVESSVLCGKFYSKDTLSRGRKAGFEWNMITVNFANFLSLLKGGDDIVALQEKRKS